MLKLKQFEIKGLFNRFDYTIEFPDDENIKIITGPNGYGKTQILNILYSIFTNQSLFGFIFKSIKIELNNGEIFDLKSTEKNSTETYSKLTTFPETYLIREQRLWQKRILEDVEPMPWEKKVFTITNTLDLFSDKLYNLIDKVNDQYLTISKNLDSTFPLRLVNESNRIEEQDYVIKYQELREKQKRLVAVGLLSEVTDFPDFKEDASNALSVYLSDMEQKLAVFDTLLIQLELFSSIINTNFEFKKIKINPQNADLQIVHFAYNNSFYFEDDNQNRLENDFLSSGEQQQVILWYELIFNVKPESLVLIDEPEISLHVAWQTDFLDNIERLQAFKPLQVIVATHSPSIIGSRFNLSYDLYGNGASQR